MSCTYDMLHSHRPAFDPKRLAFDPYTYEKGRWLDKDAERRQSRTLQYDFDSLLSAAVDCSPGAKAVVGCEKKEGTHNRIFLISLDSGKTVVARLPTQSTGPAGLAMESEVATLLFRGYSVWCSAIKGLTWRFQSKQGRLYLFRLSWPGIPIRRTQLERSTSSWTTSEEYHWRRFGTT